MSQQHEDAVARAKAIAARLSGESTISNSPGTKRKRWGLQPEDDNNEPPVKVAKQKSLDETRRVWVSATDTRPIAHFAVYLRQHLESLELPPDTLATLQGKGSSSEPPPPGMPQQPLHVVLSASTRVDLDSAEAMVDQLLREGREVDLLAEDEKEEEQQEDKSRALVATGSSGYRPASVAQLIGQANLPDVAPGEDWIDENLQVPQSVVGYLIGRGGETISSIQIRTGCKMQIEKQGGLGSSQRTISLSAPTRDALQNCKNLIQKMVREKAGPGAAQAKYSRTVAVPNAHVGLVIGKQGTTIRSIQETTGAEVQVPAMADDRGMRMVQITHSSSEEGAKQAQEWIERIIGEKKGELQHNDEGFGGGGAEETVQVPIPDQDVGLCIGKAGCVVKEMQNLSGCRVQIPAHATPGAGYRMVSVTGRPEGIEKVKQMINAIVTTQSSAPVMSGTYAHHALPVLQQQQPQNQQYSAEWAAYHAAQQQAQQQQAPTPAAVTTAAATAAPAGADAYYEDFFRYEYYYGEPAARKHYGAWSPPVGTPNPYGVNPNLSAPPAAAPVAAPAAHAAATTAAPTAAVEDSSARETGRRKVSNLPAWMTKK